MLYGYVFQYPVAAEAYKRDRRNGNKPRIAQSIDTVKHLQNFGDRYADRVTAFAVVRGGEIVGWIDYWQALDYLENRRLPSREKTLEEPCGDV